MKKIIYILLIILLGEAVFAVSFFLTPGVKEIPKEKKAEEKVNTGGASLYFAPDSVTVKPFQNFDTKIVLSAEEKIINSADLYITYDPKLLEASISGGILSIKQGEYFSIFPSRTLDAKTGNIYLLGVRDFYTKFKDPGSAMIEADTNKNVLGETGEMEVEITD